MAVDAQTVRHVAKLARIRLEPQQEQSLATELSNILDWVEQLNQLDTDGVEPMTSVAEMGLKTREDVVSDGGRQDDIVANAPQSKHGFFVVPRVVE
jgi:aspartyl-tRNA(Asn)/glutamyl-tRNA(Gln) amidotransferase subunit C